MMRMMGRVVWESLLRRCGIVNHDCHDVEMMRMIPAPHVIPAEAGASAGGTPIQKRRACEP